MLSLELFSVFVFGTVIGSFLNVLILRYGSGMTLGGRSRCFSCGTRLSWGELVPILSFILQRGKCRTCRARISAQYVIVELATGLAFAMTYWTQASADMLDFLPLLLSLASWGTLVAIFAYDSKHTVIPDAFVWTFNILALASALYRLWPNVFTAESIVPLLAGPMIALPFFLLWVFSRGTFIGLGDAKLALGIGWLLGLSGGLSAVMIGVWIGTVWSLAIMAIQRLGKGRALPGRKITAKTEIPFAPFLILGIAAVYFFGWSAIVF